MREIVARDIVQNVKLQTPVERGDERIWNILERSDQKERSSLEPRTDPSPFGGIQAFEPVLIDGKCFACTPLVW